MAIRHAVSVLALSGAAFARPNPQLAGVGDLLTSDVPAIATTAVSVVSGILSDVTSALGGAQTSIASDLSSVVAADPTVSAALSQITSDPLATSADGGLVGTLTSDLGGVTSDAASIVSDATSLISSVLSGAQSDISGIIGTATSLGDGAVSTIDSILSSATSEAISLVDGATSDLGGILPSATSGLSSLLSSITANPSLSLSLPLATSTSGNFSLSSTASASSSTGLGLFNSSSSASASSTGFGFNQTASASASSTGLGFNKTMSASATASGGFNATNSGGRRPVTNTRSSTASSTATGTTTSAPGSTTVPTPVIPAPEILNFNGVEFLIEFDITYTGILIDLAILFKRDGYTLENCLKTCAVDTDCAGTAYDSDTATCTFYSSINGSSRKYDNSTTFGTVLVRPTNSTGTNSTGTNSTGSGSYNGTAESLICPSYNGHVITAAAGSSSFAIGCGEFLVGAQLDIETQFSKRQTLDTGLPMTISNCVDICGLAPSCVGTVFDIANNVCTYYSSVNYAMAMDGFDAATKVASNANNNNNGGSGTTATTTTTAYVLPPGVTAGPGGSGVTTTATIYSISASTVYINSPQTQTVVYGSSGQPTTVMVGGYPAGATVTSMVAVGPTAYVNSVPTASFASSPATVTVTVHDVTSYCPA